jgi:hypothetical protein
MAKIPASLREPIDTAFPANVILVGSVQPDGYAQITPRGSAQVHDDEHISLWERGRGSTNAAITEGTKLTFFLRSPQLRASGALPNGGIARFYGTATVHKSGAVYDKIWERLIQAERDRDPEKKGFAVLVKIERAENLAGQALTLS